MLANSWCWWLTVVYGPCIDVGRVEFLRELKELRATRPGAWMVCGDFNIIYLAANKSNSRLDRRSMRLFSGFLGDVALSEVHLNGRLFTWSNQHDHPTLERIDRVFVSSDWLELLPNHWLRALSLDCSDHSPLLLQTCCVPWAKRCFRFESIWTKFPGFLDTVRDAWECAVTGLDPCRALDIKLRSTATALKGWSNKFIGSFRLQLAVAR